jgi:hypothetical protein
MYPYTTQLTLDEALNLEKVNKTALVYDSDYEDSLGCNPDELDNWDIPSIYRQGDYLSCDALTYATYILNQATPPEGWGYAAYELSSGRYDSLPYFYYDVDAGWKSGVFETFGEKKKENKIYWNRNAFRLTDLARVEEQKTEINLGQAKWLKEKEQRFTYWLNGVIYKDGLFIEADIYNVRNGDKYELLNSTYNALPQEFKDLAREEAESEATKPLNQKSFGEIFEESAKNNMWPERPDARPSKQEQTFGQFMGKVLEAVDWESKYHELEKIVDELKTKNEELATAALNLSHNIATTHQTNEKNLQDSLLEAQNTIAIYEKRISDLDYYKSISDDYVKAFEQRDAAKETLKQAEINLIEARNDYYPY